MRKEKAERRRVGRGSTLAHEDGDGVLKVFSIMVAS